MARADLQNPETRAKFEAKLEEHYRLFTRLMWGLTTLLKAVRRVGGDYVHEWGAYNPLWKDPLTLALIELMSLTRVYFDGCAVGLVTDDGVPIRKPWSFATTIPEVVCVFKGYKCPCPKGTEHARCKGRDAKNSAFYTWFMVGLLHQAFEMRQFHIGATIAGWRSWTH
jgi:hypothetical protein